MHTWVYIKWFNAPSPDQILNTWLAEGHVISNNVIYWPMLQGPTINKVVSRHDQLFLVLEA